MFTISNFFFVLLLVFKSILLLFKHHTHCNKSYVTADLTVLIMLQDQSGVLKIKLYIFLCDVMVKFLFPTADSKLNYSLEI